MTDTELLQGILNGVNALVPVLQALLLCGQWVFLALCCIAFFVAISALTRR